MYVPYARHYNPLLIRNRSWILTIHKARILRKKPLEKTFLDIKKWVKSIQTAGCDGARTVFEVIWFLTWKTVLTTCWDSCLPVQIETALINSSGDIALSARVYIFMAIWKSSRLLRNKQKSLNSSKVMPLRSRPSALSLCNLSASLSSIVSYSSVLRKVYLRRILANSQG